MPDDAQAVSNQSKLISIAEMSVDEELLGIRRGGSLRRHEGISHAVGIDLMVVLVINF